MRQRHLLSAATIKVCPDYGGVFVDMFTAVSADAMDMLHLADADRGGLVNTNAPGNVQGRPHLLRSFNSQQPSPRVP